jgi:raffinose/stachyose/melibiose transport system substrate-binding protein
MTPRILSNTVLPLLTATSLVVLTACSGPGLSPASATSAPAGQAPAAPSGGQAAPAASGAAVTLSLFIDDSSGSRDTTNALVSAYTAAHPNVTINVETHPGGTDGDNLVKTRLASGEMSDIFSYNSGSLLQALHPVDTLVDLSKEPWIENVDPTFLPTVSQNGQVFGAPYGPATSGGMLYNKKVYQQLGLSVPKSWAEFEANNDKIKAAGIAPVIASYGTSWTSQLFVLADYCNVQNQAPNFATDYTANKAKYASTPAAMEGFTYLQEGNQKGWYQQDYSTTTYEQGLKLLADGKGAQYPILSGGLQTIAANSPNVVNDIGFFGQPGTDASKSCATVWMPNGTYIPKTGKHVAEAKDFAAFVGSKAGVDAINAKVPPQGPYMIKGTKLPDNALPAVKDIAAYVDAGKSIPALEFFSPLKGPNLEQICVAVGSGQMTPQQAADNYDKDVEKQAKQLGLPGW